MENNWIEGTPDKPGIYWAELYDQGGWPFVTLFIVESTLKKVESGQQTINEFHQEVCRTGKIFDTSMEEYDKFYEICYIIPELGITEYKPISSMWNCSRYCEVEKPTLKVK